MGRIIERPSVDTKVLETWCEATVDHFCDVDDSRLYSVEPSSDGYEDVYIAKRTVFVAGFSKTHALRNLLNLPPRIKNIKLGLGTTGENDAALLAEWKDENSKEGGRAYILNPEDETLQAYYKELALLRSLIPENVTSA